MTFGRLEPEGVLVMGCKKASTVPSDQVGLFITKRHCHLPHSLSVELNFLLQVHLLIVSSAYLFISPVKLLELHKVIHKLDMYLYVPLTIIFWIKLSYSNLLICLKLQYVYKIAHFLYTPCFEFWA